MGEEDLGGRWRRREVYIFGLYFVDRSMIEIYEMHVREGKGESIIIPRFLAGANGMDTGT